MIGRFDTSEIVFASEQGDVSLWPYHVSVGGRTVADTQQGMVRHNYHQHVWIYTVEGSGRVDVAGTQHMAVPGSVSWIDTGQAYAHGASADEPWRYVWMSVSGFELDTQYDRLGFANAPVVHVPERVVTCFETVLAGLGQSGTSGRISAAVGDILEHLDVGRAGTIEVARDVGITTLLSALRKDITRPWTVAEMGALVGVSQSQLFRRFKTQTGVSPIVWLRRERMVLGAFLLRSTNDSVAQVGTRCGYSDPFHFSRDFKLEKGCAPRGYRAQFQ